MTSMTATIIKIIVEVIKRALGPKKLRLGANKPAVFMQLTTAIGIPVQVRNIQYFNSTLHFLKYGV